MTVYEVLTIALIFVVASAATLAIYLGLLNWMGRFHVVHCAACHHLMDPLGLTLESFDAIGQRQTQDAGKTIDDSGEIAGTDVDGVIHGAQELGQRLARSQMARRCFAEQFFRYAFGRAAEEDTATIDEAYRAFSAADFNVRELIVGLVQSPAFSYRKVTP